MAPVGSSAPVELSTTMINHMPEGGFEKNSANNQLIVSKDWQKEYRGAAFMITWFESRHQIVVHLNQV